MTIRTTPLSVFTILLSLSVASASDPDCGSPTYTGFALKSQSGCKSYVYCQSGVAGSETNCPEGLLFNGGVGQGGICTWAESVPCQEDEGGAATTVAAATTTTTTAAAEAVSAEGDNPNHFYCGQSRQDAAAKCLPCPSGSLLDCEDVTHGCFAGITDCAAESSSEQSSSQENGHTTSSLIDLLNSLASGGGSGSSTTTTTTTTSTASAGNAVDAPSFIAAPSPAVAVSNSQSFEASDGTPQPSKSPTLAPWTNAPFVPYRGPARPKTVIGYYAAWQWYDRNKFADPKNVDFSKYDRINYAFFQPDEQGRLFGTDEWADPQLLWGEYDYSTTTQVMSGPNRNYFCSWDGPDESQHNCNFHKGDGILSRAKAVGTEVVPSIGGWTLSDNFPTIASTEVGRTTFAANCVKLIEEYGFDGIDIDWEYPGFEDHSGTPEDTVNFTLFLQAIRDALDVLGQSKGRYFPLSAALPCGPDKIADIQVDQIKDILDELNLMSYDLHGAWDVLTGVNAPMFDQGWTDTSKGWSIHGCVENYLVWGVPMEKVNIGLPFYGRSFRKATGMKQVHDGTDDINWHLDEGSPQYFNIVKALGRMTTYRHEKTQTQYAVFNEGGGLVNYDDPRAICDKVHYAIQRGARGLLAWEISGDMLDNGETPLIDATNNKIQNPDMDCSKLRDPLWALSDTTYRYAPPEPDHVDLSSVNPLNLAAPMGYSNGNTLPAPSPTNNSPSAPTNGSPTLNANTIGISPVSPPTNNSPSFPTNNSPTLNANDPATTGSSSSETTQSSSASTSPPGDCPPDFTGYWASGDCTQYMYCQAGAVVGVLMPCVPGTLFDVTIGTCAFATNVAGCSR
ncbi:hypothetical protein HJC23_012310 [Cyclotella cryptica]|uniref:Chitinase n=1 Tax=Cyclotella cryptica TaxID=29204 RepID=A0ABD3PKZ2_9STRA|eukprot:CCRYP_013498-RB/>CCRYP_013498-RB protein AED:0.09 eAED:0.09 QI:200/1/1/1/1/1/6/209/845